MNLVERYKRGEHESAWKVLRGYPVIEGSLREEALEVARETARRVLHNLSLLIPRLEAAGWRPLGGAFLVEPSDEDARTMRELEKITGSLIPPAVQGFWEVAGGLDLIWDYKRAASPPDFGLDLWLEELDPLCIDPARSIASEFEEWKDGHRPNSISGDTYYLVLAPDHFHKANISGGMAYGVEIPFAGADPVFANEEHDLPFTDYLRLALRWAGFTRLEQHAKDPRVQQFVKQMTAGFEPF